MPGSPTLNADGELLTVDHPTYFSLSLTKTSNIYRYFAAGSEMRPFINKRKLAAYVFSWGNKNNQNNQTCKEFY